MSERPNMFSKLKPIWNTFSDTILKNLLKAVKLTWQLIILWSSTINLNTMQKNGHYFHFQSNQWALTALSTETEILKKLLTNIKMPVQQKYFLCKHTLAYMNYQPSWNTIYNPLLYYTLQLIQSRAFKKTMQIHSS